MSGLVGYARVSTRDQDYDGQIVELKAAGFTRIPLRAARISAPQPCIWDNTRSPTLPSLISSLIWIETRPSGQKRVFSWIINGLMLKMTINLESHEDEQTCHLNLGGQETLPAVRLARVTVSN